MYLSLYIYINLSIFMIHRYIYHCSLDPRRVHGVVAPLLSRGGAKQARTAPARAGCCLSRAKEQRETARESLGCGREVSRLVALTRRC